MPRTPLEAYAFDARFGKRSVFILDPRLTSLYSVLASQKVDVRDILDWITRLFPEL